MDSLFRRIAEGNVSFLVNFGESGVEGLGKVVVDFAWNAVVLLDNHGERVHVLMRQIAVAVVLQFVQTQTGRVSYSLRRSLLRVLLSLD